MLREADIPAAAGGAASCRSPATPASPAFSLVEILIVTVMIGILAMIVVPRMLDASCESREAALATNLTTLRRQIEKYKLDHGGAGPHLDEKGALDSDNFVGRLTGRTDPDGKLNDAGKYGPYVIEWPGNPFCPDDVASSVAFGARPAPPRNGKAGWYYCTDTAVLSANSTQGGESLDPPGAAPPVLEELIISPVERLP